MLPNRSSSGTGRRRSSILKPPKSRQPFQDLAFNTSSPEISPESTKKRRVSFAEKKHVKEFCDHKEQGTIWDNTYEESDQNVSKSIEISNENAAKGYTENVGIMRNEADSEALRNFITDGNGGENLSRAISFNSDLEVTEVIPSSQITPNCSMSRTILCQDGDLEITETIGGIEPTISMKKIIGLKPRETRDSPGDEKEIKNTEKTMLFDDSGGEMMFTEIISGIKNVTSIDNQLELEKSNSLIENQTIIFEDSIMDLTLTKSQEESSLDGIKNVESIPPRITADEINKENENIDAVRNIEDSNNSQSSRNVNKTIFFDNIGCEMTDVVNIKTITQKVPEFNVENKENLPTEFYNVKSSGGEISEESKQSGKYTLANERNDLSNGLDSETQNSELRTDKTIFFNNIGCEMTEAIDTLENGLARVENLVEQDRSEQILPLELLPTNLVTENMEMEIEPCESSSKLMSKCNDGTEYFDDSVMEFTTAVNSREKNMENDETGDEYILKKDKTVIFDDCNVEITEAVKTPPCIINLESNLEGRDNNDPLNGELECEESRNNKKRKSFESIEVNIDCNKSGNSLMNQTAECNETNLVQSLVSNECDDRIANENLSNTFAPNCKRFKVTDVISEEEKNDLGSEYHFSTAETELLENITNRTVNLSIPKNTEQISDMQMEVFEDLVTENDSVDNLAKQDAENIEKNSQDTVSNCYNDEERLSIDDEEEEEAKELVETIDDDNVGEEEPSFIEARLSNLNSNSYADSDFDSESEALELSRMYIKQHQSTIERIDDEESQSEAVDCLDFNDDCCFVMFSEQLKKHSESNDCIWTIRYLDKEKVLIDFISKSLVIVIDLESSEELTTPKMIKNIKIISLLGDSANENISMIHNILLKKLDPDNLKRFHKTTQDVLPMLEIISHKVKLMLDFMYEFDKLEDLHLINKSGNRISFLLHSYKVQMVIKITINLEPFEDIGPNDVKVECILGNIREKDIKQLITSVKKDHKFLTNYIDDIKEYIALVVEK